MQPISRYVFGFLAGAALVLLGTNTFAQNTFAPDNASEALVYRESSELKRSDKTPSDSERINTLEETLRQQGDQLDEMRKLLVEQQETIKLLAGKLGGVGPAPTGEERVVAGNERSETADRGSLQTHNRQQLKIV